MSSLCSSRRLKFFFFLSLIIVLFFCETCVQNLIKKKKKKKKKEEVKREGVKKCFSSKSKLRWRFLWCVHGARAPTTMAVKRDYCIMRFECQRATMISPFVSSFVFNHKSANYSQLLVLCTNTCYCFSIICLQHVNVFLRFFDERHSFEKK